MSAEVNAMKRFLVITGVILGVVGVFGALIKVYIKDDT